MTLVRFNNRPAGKSFNNLMDGFLNNLPSIFNEEAMMPGLQSAVPVNIKETQDEYVLDVFAPGMDKEDFKINLDNNTLTVSAEKKAESLKENEKQIRREFRHQSFKRSFTVDEQIDAEKIVAKYLNGVLTLNLPKKPEVKNSVKEIAIQ